MKIKIALCDDDRRALPIVAGAAESAFAEKGIQTDISRFRSGAELLRAMDDTLFQLVLLDIEMPGMDGIALGKKIRERGDATQIVYVSENESRVFESFLVQPLGFVRKSNFLNDISAVVELYIKNHSAEENSEILQLNARSGLLSVPCTKIRYIEGSRNYQMLYLKDKAEPLEVKNTMQKLEEMTEPHGFLRIHKGYLVNYRFIQRITTGFVALHDGTELPIGRSKSVGLKEKYLELLGK